MSSGSVSSVPAGSTVRGFEYRDRGRYFTFEDEVGCLLYIASREFEGAGDKFRVESH